MIRKAEDTMTNADAQTLGNTRKLQHACLMAAGCMELLAIITGAMLKFVGFNLMETYLIIPAVLFWGVTLTRELPREARKLSFLCLAMSLWAILTRTIHLIQAYDTNHIGLFLGLTLLPLPFAALTGDDREQKGLRNLAVCYAAGAACLVLGTVLLLLDLVPGWLDDSIRWDGARLYALWHPNVGGGLFMIGTLLTLGLSIRCSRPWGRALLVVLAGGMFCCLSLTHSRTSTMIACGGVGLLVFLLLAAKGGWKRYLLGVLAALVVAAGLLALSSAVYAGNEQRLIAMYTQQEDAQSEDSPLLVNQETGEVSLRTSNGQGELSQDIRTLNGRTKIWAKAYYTIQEYPQILLFGHHDPGMLLFTNWNPNITHTHNAWVEVLMRQGLPGLGIALIFTWFAFRGALFTLWSKACDLWKKSIAVLVLCILAVSMLEPYLFTSDAAYQAVNFIFYLAAGYLDQWYRAGRKSPLPENPA